MVGERISKAIGSAFNTLAKTIEQSLRIGTLPSFLSALGLWLVCYYVGKRFDKLLETGKIVGLEHSIDPSTYSRVPRGEDNEDDAFDGRNYDYHFDEPSEVEIMFEEDNVSTLDLMASPTGNRFVGRTNARSEAPNIGGIEMPPLSRI